MILPAVALAEPSHARAAMRTEVARAAPGKPFLAAVEIDTDPHWHVYWKNPGDSGVPTQIEWGAPKGWRVEPLEFPAPRRFAPGGITAYGYEGRTLFLARVTPSAVSGSISAKVKWLVCSQACIAGGAMVTVKVPLGKAATGPQAMAIQKAQRDLPRPLAAPAEARMGKAVVLTVTVPASLAAGKQAEFFPAETGTIDQAKPALATLSGSRLVFKMSPSPFPEKHSRLPGLIVFTSHGRRQAMSVAPELQKETNL